MFLAGVMEMMEEVFPIESFDRVKSMQFVNFDMTSGATFRLVEWSIDPYDCARFVTDIKETGGHWPIPKAIIDPSDRSDRRLFEMYLTCLAHVMTEALGHDDVYLPSDVFNFKLPHPLLIATEGREGTARTGCLSTFFLKSLRRKGRLGRFMEGS
jgi:hypothetical protein|tara:strand:- start:486 stop:950 length:465 start_codon:yes stop_codon:yes gene_type:complete